jgi:hypothetical protein
MVGMLGVTKIGRRACGRENVLRCGRAEGRDAGLAGEDSGRVVVWANTPAPAHKTMIVSQIFIGSLPFH